MLEKLNNRKKRRSLDEMEIKHRKTARWELRWYQRRLDELKGEAHAYDVVDYDLSSSSAPPAREQPTKAARKAIATGPSLPEVDNEEAESSLVAAANAQPTGSQRKKGVATKSRVPEERGSETIKTKGEQKDLRETSLNTRSNGGITNSPSMLDGPGSEEDEA